MCQLLRRTSRKRKLKIKKIENKKKIQNKIKKDSKENEKRRIKSFFKIDYLFLIENNISHSKSFSFEMKQKH